MTGSSPAPVTLPDTCTDASHSHGAESSDECIEKRVYYKIISGTLWSAWLIAIVLVLNALRPGLHASISTHLCHEHLNQSTGEWVCSIEFVTLTFVNMLHNAGTKFAMLRHSCGIPSRTIAIYVF